MEEYGGHPLFPKIKLLLKEGKKPFDQSVISISDAWKYLEKEEKAKGNLNEFADILIKLKCERIGECKHKKTGKKIITYLTKNFAYFDGMSNAEVISSHWLPSEITLESNGSETYDLSKSEIGEIRDNLYKIKAYEDMMDNEEKPKILRFESGDYSKAIRTKQ